MVRHIEFQSNVPVGYIMISLYCWRSNVNKSFEIKISSEQTMNSLKTTCFKWKPSIVPYYSEAAFMKTMLLLFSHEFHIWKYFACFESIINIKLLKNNILAKKQHGKIFTVFFHPNYWTQNSNWFFFDVPTKHNAPSYLIPHLS